MHRTIFARPHRWVLRDFSRGKTQSVEQID
jgi:hypothetical protein